MQKLFKTELLLCGSEIKKLDSKIITIFLSSTIILTISWYFANPEFFKSAFEFIEFDSVIFEDFTAYSYWFIFDCILFFLIPALILKLGFNENLTNYGIRIGNGQIGTVYTFAAVILFIPIIYFISFSENFSIYFPLMQEAKTDWKIFLLYEIMFIFFIFSWEFVFRGFMLFGLEKKFGLYSIFIQMVPFVLLHNGKPFIETFAAIIGGIFLGYLAIRTRSIIYGFLIHAFILITLDITAFLSS